MKKILLALSATFAVCLAVFAGTNMCLKKQNGDILKFNVDDIYEVYYESFISGDTTIVPPFIEPSVKDTSAYAPLRFRITSDSTVELTYGNYRDLDSVNIPAKVKIDGKVYSVTEIGDRVFSGCSNLTSIAIPSSVTSIGSSAFGGCSSLTEIIIPSSVTSIGSSAFFNCKNLDVVIDNSKEDSKFFGWKDEGSMINSGVFRDVHSVKWLRKPNPSGEDVSAYSPLLFKISSDSTVELYQIDYSYDDLDSVLIPAKVKIDGKLYSVTSISGAFRQYHNQRITYIGIPESVTSIVSYAFYDCSSLESINVDAKNPNYSSLDGILYNKDKTEVIKVPSQGVKGSHSISSSVTSIGSLAFEGCSSLTSIAIPSSVTEIGDRAFSGCENLDVVIDNSEENVKVGDDAFKGVKSVKWLKEIDEDPSVSDTSAYAPLRFWITSDSTAELTCGNYLDLDSVNIPAKVKIGGKVYSVTEIGGWAFSGYSNLTSIAIPSSVTSIGPFAFEGCSNLTSIEIPSSVTEIGDRAFSGCKNLDVVIDNSEENVKVGDDAFKGVKSVKWLK